MTSLSGRARLFSVIIAACGIGMTASADPPNGEQLFKRQCAVCHSVQPGQVLMGPSLAGLIDRPAGSVTTFRYSPAMKSSGLVWDEETVKTFIESPRKLIPGTNMAFPGERDPAKREAIVEYLAGLE